MTKKEEYNNKYNKENYKGISFRLSTKNEADLIDWMSDKDTKSYIVSLIRKDMKLAQRRERERKKKDEDLRTDEID